MLEKLNANVFVTYGGSLPDDYWLIQDRCTSLVEALESSKSDHNIVILTAGPNPDFYGSEAFKDRMSRDIVEELQFIGYLPIGYESNKVTLMKDDKKVYVVTTKDNHWGTPEQTDAMIREIYILSEIYSIETIHVVITKENIPQLKFVWNLFYHGSAKLEFSGKPSRDKRNLKYHLMEYLRMFNAFGYYAHIRRHHH